MKILRTHIISGALAGLIALLAAPFSSAQGQPPARFSVPNGFTLVASLQMFDTMEGHKNVIAWDCYAPFDTQNNKPGSRTKLWLVGTLKWNGGYGTDLNLFEIGAQHRTHKVRLRLASKNQGQKSELWQIRKNSGVVNVKLTPDTDGFYDIDEVLPLGGTKRVNEYVIRTDDPVLQLEAYFTAHPPMPALTMLQVDDGGPPSIPPVNEN